MNTQPRHPKCRALPVEPHPDIHFSAMIPRRGVKIKIFLSVVIHVVKATFMPFSAIGGNPANAGVTRLCGVSPCPVPDTATALPNVAPYQLSHTRIFNFCHYTTAKNQRFSCLWSFMWSKPLLCRFRQPEENPLSPVPQGIPGFCPSRAWIGSTHTQSRRATNCATPGYFVILSGWSYSPKPGAIPTSLYPDKDTPPASGRRIYYTSFFSRLQGENLSC